MFRCNLRARTGGGPHGLACLLMATALLAGCTTPAEPDPVTTSAMPSPTATASGTDRVVTAELGRVDDDLVDAALAFVLTQLDPAAGPAARMDEADYAETFAEEFRTQVPFEELQAVFEDLRAVGPYRVTTEVSRSEVGELLVRSGTDDGVEMSISLFVTPGGQINGLLFGPGNPPTLQTPVSTLEEAVDALAERGTLRLLAADVEEGVCTPSLALGADDPAPVGSAIALYVLAAVADAIAGGALSWDSPLVIAPDVKSLPPGVLHDRPDFSRVTVQEAAELMVQVNDGTATDLLLRTVGRAAVEEAQARWGHSAPALNTPFLTTRELFVLEDAEGEVQQRFVDGDEATRREVLDELASADLPSPSSTAGAPTSPELLGWFASPADLCRVMAALLDRSAEEALDPLEAILTARPGVPDEEDRWSRIAFKGGSAAGLLAAVWLVEDDGGRRHALTTSLVDVDAPLDEVQTILLMAAARDHLGS